MKFRSVFGRAEEWLRGRPFAPYELAVHLGGLLDLGRAWNFEQRRRRRDRALRAVLQTHVGDISVKIEGVDGDDVVRGGDELAEQMASTYVNWV